MRAEGQLRHAPGRPSGRGGMAAGLGEYAREGPRTICSDVPRLIPPGRSDGSTGDQVFAKRV